MVLVNCGQSILYMSSPYIINPKIMLDSNLFLSDMSRADATRDLIMLGQTRVSQQNIK